MYYIREFTYNRLLTANIVCNNYHITYPGINWYLTYILGGMRGHFDEVAGHYNGAVESHDYSNALTVECDQRV